MDAVLNYPQRTIKAVSFSLRPRRLGHHCALLGLIGALGVLAFIFSAVSPDDDDIQQEFVQSSKSKQFVLANYKTVSNLCTFLINTVSSAIRVSIPDKFSARIFTSRTGDRSPPTKSS